MNPTIFLLFALFFLAYYCQGMEKGQNSNAVVKPQNTGTSIPVIKPTIKEVKLFFEENAPFILEAFHGDAKQPFYSAATNEEKRDEKVWQSVMMPMDEEGWDKLDVITLTFNDDYKEKVKKNN
ncbi:hypothetical protein niasHS_009674 [Heterodera schachtii]|uniref:Uncharacterized protein n=1 Tax=Heterodera schachtii TaxID=97005 RepID=A0ABD2J6D5_HETSC